MKWLRTYPEVTDVDSTSSEVVNPSYFDGVDKMSSQAVDKMLAQTPAILLSVLVHNVFSQQVVWLLESRITPQPSQRYWPSQRSWPSQLSMRLSEILSRGGV
jgi:hypothetical protein